jgi:D-3-phosphoglycerate dehydrogenase / 2-oxoglutarate reductase
MKPRTLSPELTKVLLLENVHASAVSMLKAQGYQVETQKSALKEAELIAAAQSVHILGIRSKTHLSANFFASAPHLIGVGAFCIGTNQVDLDAANAAGVPVFNAPFSNTRSVAELVIGEIVVLARQLGDRSREVHAGKWSKVATSCFEVRGKTLGIVGYGHIGSQVGVLAEAMGMRVISFDVRSTMAIGNAKPIASLDELLAASDFVTLHVPETPLTKNLIGKDELAKMRAGSYLINAARGTVVDIEALADALRSGHLRGAAIDVYPEEPESNSDGFVTPLQNLSNVILTPHVGGSTEEAQEAIGREVATSIGKFLGAGTTDGAVNFPQAELARKPGAHRILNVHRNVPGVLRDINRIVSDRNANIGAQLLATDPKIGYLIMDIDEEIAFDVTSDIAQLKTNIRTRIV